MSDLLERVPARSQRVQWREFGSEAILLDPVYSGKGAAGLIDLIRKGHFKKGERVVFLHTGGAAGLFAYTSAFSFSQAPAVAAQ